MVQLRQISAVVPPLLQQFQDFPATVWKGRWYSKLRRDLVAHILVCTILMMIAVDLGPEVKCALSNAEYELALHNHFDELCWTERFFIVEGVNSTKPVTRAHKTSHTLYNWINSLFWMHLGILIAPYIIWVIGDSHGSLQKLTQDLDRFYQEEVDKKEVESFDPKKVNKMARFLVEGFNRKCSAVYVHWFFLVEVVAWMATVASITGLDFISNFSFSGEGLNVLYHLIKSSLEVRTDELAERFPVTVHCDFSKYGPSGGEDFRSSLCVLPGNIILTRGFIILWMAEIFLWLADTANLVYRLTCLLSMRLRYMLICESAWKLDQRKVRRVNEKLDFSTWFLLYEIAMKCDVEVFSLLIDGMDNELNSNNLRVQDWQEEDTQVKHTFRNSIQDG